MAREVGAGAVLIIEFVGMLESGMIPLHIGGKAQFDGSVGVVEPGHRVGGAQEVVDHGELMTGDDGGGGDGGDVEVGPFVGGDLSKRLASS